MSMWLVAMALQVSAALAEERPVTFRQDEMQWPVVVSASGTVSVRGDTLLLKLRDVDVADQPTNPSTILYVSYHVCLARQVPEAQEAWASASCSEPVRIMALPQSDETVRLPKRKLTIPLAGLSSLDGYWLVLEMTSKPMQDYPSQSVHAHSPRDVFDMAAP